MMASTVDMALISPNDQRPGLIGTLDLSSLEESSRVAAEIAFRSYIPFG